VRFSAQHRFHLAPAAVVTVLSDPSFYAELEIPDLGRAELMEHRSAGNVATVRLRYEFVGHLDPIVHRILAHQRLSWIQEIVLDLPALSGTITYAAESNPRLLHGQATFVLEPDGEGTVRRLEGELVVAVTGISTMAEHRIVPGLLRRLDVEAAAVYEHLLS
jgi:hypothetical protein